MHRYFYRILSGLLLAGLCWTTPLVAQTQVKKVILQGFWWDYWNSNFPNRWADYLTELTPRLKEIGIDGVWIPPAYKNNSPSSVGYVPFDYYDLGDKYQKGDLRTRVGDKDELLRLVAVMHANNLEVIQDMVLNHTTNAGSTTGAGGQDLFALSNYNDGSTQGYKNFRYVSYATPATDESANDYLNRSGRWAKNWPNFYPNQFNACCNNDINSVYWGPDISYESNAYGQSSCIGCYNPPQTTNYMRNESRNWIMWYKKQTGVNGFRWDAVKHFPTYVQQDLSFNVKYIVPAWAQGGNAMFNVGEYVGNKSELDAYVNHIYNANGGNEKLMGTFDFGLRAYDASGGIYSMVYSLGGYNLANIPGAQQNERYVDYNGGTLRVHRTVPFVNNHDTYRPQLDANGNITGWNTGSELSPHIDPSEPRLSAAYAIILTVDGSPQIFFEDLFNLNQSNRYTHQPTDPATLPVRPDIANLIWCHQNLDFDQGNYIVPHASADYLILGRSGRALVGITDNYSTWQNQYVTGTGFAPGTVLKDYSGANGTATVTVDGNGGVNINTPPVNPALNIAGRHGYSVWAPVGQDGDVYTGPASTLTVQEWEMANDLGDSHCESLGQGGRTPDNSCNRRIAGNIQAAGGQLITTYLYPANPALSLTLELWDLDGNMLQTVSGTGNLTLTYTPAATGWYTLKVRNTAANTAGQVCFVQAQYTGPTSIDTDLTPPDLRTAIWTGNGGTSTWTDCRNWEEGLIPNATTDALIPACASPQPVIAGSAACLDITIQVGATLTLSNGATLAVHGNWNNQGSLGTGCGLVQFVGSGNQLIYGNTDFCQLAVDNIGGVSLLGSQVVTQALTLTAGTVTLGDYDLTLTGEATLTGGSADAYIETLNLPAGGGDLIRVVNATPTRFPIGTAGVYTPVTLTQTGTATAFRARVFAGVYEQGNQGNAVADPGCIINRTWDIAPSGTPAGALNVTAAFQWDGAQEGATFDRAQSFISKNAGGPSGTWSALSPPQAATGTGPYVQTVSGITSFSLFKCISCTAETFPVTWLQVSGYNDKGIARLEWLTGTEVQNQGFFVEKSLDRVTFEDLGFVPAAGNSSEPTAYRFEDHQLNQTSYYRLRQRDFSGAESLSDVIEIRYDPAWIGIRLTPNPVREQITLTVSGYQPDEHLRIRITDMLGKTVLETTGTLGNVQSALSRWNTQATPGVYTASIRYRSQVAAISLLKE
ncbi:MAG: alpha-amylase domain-containing protein [Bacteroidia bacterium]|nr:alpha-amylase domain-containing protein [Bacteroidia bacterium]